MQEPGVIHIEAHLSEATGTCVYDSNQIGSEQVLAFLAERAGNFPATLVNDLPLSET